MKIHLIEIVCFLNKYYLLFYVKPMLNVLRSLMSVAKLKESGIRYLSNYLRKIKSGVRTVLLRLSARSQIRTS